MRGKVCTVFTACTMLFTLLLACLGMNVAAEDVAGIGNNLTSDGLQQSWPAIWEDTVVWSERVEEEGGVFWEIFLYDLSADSDNDDIPNYRDLDDDGDGIPDYEDTDLDPAKIRITYVASNKTNPEIHGDTIVWEDDRHGNFEIYMYDLSEDTDDDQIPNYRDSDDDGDGTSDVDDADTDPAEIRITDNPSHQTNPVVYGTRIVWVDRRYGNKDLMLYDMGTEREYMLAGRFETGNPRYMPRQDHPSIHGDIVAWEEGKFSDGYWEINSYNLSIDSDGDGVPNYRDDDRPEEDPAESRITYSSNISDFKPWVYGNMIAYVRADNVTLYDMTAQMEYQITHSMPEHDIEWEMCGIHGSKIIFNYGIDGDYSVHMYDMSVDSDDDGIPNYREPNRPLPDPALSVIAENSSTNTQPVIYANKIVWQQWNTTDNAYDIMLFSMTDNLPPVISHRAPDDNPEILEGQWLNFNITAHDPESEPLAHQWFLDNQPVPWEITDTYNYTTDNQDAGLHEVKVVISDAEYTIESIWKVWVTEGNIAPPFFTSIAPISNPSINETETLVLNITASDIDSEMLNISWIWDTALDQPPVIYNSTSSHTISSRFTYTSILDTSGSDYTVTINITCNVTDGMYHASHTWILNVNYLGDTDGDGYSDSVETTWSSDPLDASSIPPDLDGDYIVDGEDDDIDGDGYLNKDDDYPLDPERHTSDDDGNWLLFLIIVIAVIVVAVVLVMILKSRKP